MKTVVGLLPLAVLASAMVYPDEQLFAQIPIEQPKSQKILKQIPYFQDLRNYFKKPFHRKHESHSQSHALDHALAKEKYHDCHQPKRNPYQETFNFEGWLEDSFETEALLADDPHPPHPPHPPVHPHPPHPHPPGKHPHRRPGHGGRRRHRHGHHHYGKPNHTIYELISKSKYTTKFAKLINDDPDLVKLLNSTKANHTLFVPTDYAFKRVPKKIDIPKDVIKKIILYHVSPGLWPTFGLLFQHTAPTELKLPTLGDNPQRLLAKWLGPIRGVRINYYSKVVAGNIPATNGIIHGLSAILVPPPPAIVTISHLPGTFSTLLLAIEKTSFKDEFNATEHHIKGGTYFAPTNLAFKLLGPRINAFLFSHYGLKYLKALLEYHTVLDRTLYSTAYYDGTKSESFFPNAELSSPLQHHDCNTAHRHSRKSNEPVEPSALIHVDLPTLLKDTPLAVDIVRYGPFVTIKVNGFVRVAAQDGIARDGVIQVVNRVLIPPKRLSAEGDWQYWNGKGELSVEDLKERLEPFVKADCIDERLKMDL